MSRLGRGYPNIALARRTPGVSPVLYDAVGAGATASSGTSISWSHTATAGAWVFACAETLGDTLTTATYGGTAMTAIANIGTGYAVYGLPNAPGGAKTVVVNKSGSTHSMGGNSVSYLNVRSLGAVISSTSVTSETVSVLPLGMTLAWIIGAALSSGGTSRWTNSTSTPKTIADSVGSTTYVASASAAFIGFALNPLP